MNKPRLLLVSFLLVTSFMAMSGSLFAMEEGAQQDAIAERIKRVGSVCVEGADCGRQGSDKTVARNDNSGAQANYKKTCATCHNIGVAGAPKFGDVEQWQPRIAKGMDVLYASSIDGMPPAMPAKGLCFACSDGELKDIVDYMVEAAR